MTEHKKGDVHPSLERKLGVTEAVSLNMIDMVGIGPFVTLPLIMQFLPGRNALLAWVIGAILAFSDSFIWGELGAAYPEAGGSYNFLKRIFGKKYGRLFAFLYTWQTAIQAPLVVASGAIGFSFYFQYLIPLPEWWQQKLVSVVLIGFVYFLLNRSIISNGRLAKVLWAGILLVLGFIIVSGFYHFDQEILKKQASFSFDWLSFPAWIVLGQASVKSIYCYLGYYNVCHLGGEIQEPQKNIPKSMIWSVVGIATLYLLLQWIVLGNISTDEASASPFLFSTLMQHWFGDSTARWFTLLVLWVALSSLFAVMLGYSRVLYAAADDGNFIPAFARIDKEKKIPHISILWLSVAGMAFSLLFKLKQVIDAIIVLRIFTQFISQALGLLWLQQTGIRKTFPWKMPLFPLPLIVSVIIWFFVFITSGWQNMLGAGIMIMIGLIVFANKERKKAS